MEPSSDSYETTALVYIRLVRQTSEEAAVDIEQIHALYGAHAALRAALIITLLKMEVQQNRWLPNLSLYEHLLADFPQAVPLMNHALSCCLEVWALPFDEIGVRQDHTANQPEPNALPPRDLWHPLTPEE